jgi:hypothetical protein
MGTSRPVREAFADMGSRDGGRPLKVGDRLGDLHDPVA